MSVETKTVGILYPGEMGAALGQVLTPRGIRCVTTLVGRRDATARRCREAGIVTVESLGEVVRQADVVLSVVPPSAAGPMVDLYCRHADWAPMGAVFVDVNSTSPQLAAALATRVQDCGIGFVDAAVNGLASNLTTMATLFLSGQRGSEVASLFEGAVRTRVLGSEVGRASAMKMLLAGISKGTCALFLELAVLADRRGMLAEMIEATQQIYPGIGQLVDRMLPTYAAHAARRAEEMCELEATALASDLGPPVIEGVRHLHELLAELPFAEANGDKNKLSVPEFVRCVTDADVLAASEPLAARGPTQ
jgi:3-hydroxyisobutyrate dehydrogenase-like beta-hydroxyacid dehydrogenase